MDAKAILNSLPNLDEVLKLLGDDHFDYSDEDNPKMSDTMAQLLDKLSIVNLKMYMNQDILYEVRRQSPEEFKKRWGNNLGDLHNILKKCTDLNVQRARLVDEFDRRLVAALKGEIKPEELSAPQHKNY